MELSETKWLALKGISGIIAIHLDGLSKAKENLDLLLMEISEENRPASNCGKELHKGGTVGGPIPRIFPVTPIPPQENKPTIWTCMTCGTDLDARDFPQRRCELCGEPVCPECAYVERDGKVWCVGCYGETRDGAPSEKPS